MDSSKDAHIKLSLLSYLSQFSEIGLSSLISGAFLCRDRIAVQFNLSALKVQILILPMLTRQTPASATDQLQKESKAKLGSYGAAFLYIQAGIGAISTIVPYAWFYQGLLTGLVSLLIGVVFLLQGGYQFVKLALQTRAYTLQYLSLTVMGPKCQTCVNIVMIFNQSVMVISALYVSSTSLSGFLYEITSNSNSLWLSRHLCTLYIYIGLAPLFFKRQVKQIKITGIVQVTAAFLLLLLATLYLVQNYSYIRKEHPHSQFHIPLLPHRRFAKTMSQIFTVFMAPGFAQVSLPIIKSMGPISVRKGFKPMIIATLFVALYCTLLAVVSMALFGDLLLSYDTVIKAFSANSQSLLASLLQLIGISITIFHTPIQVFTLRESLLLLFFKLCRSLHSQSGPKSQEETELISSQSKFPIMYERVSRCAFYSVTSLLFVALLLCTLYLSNLISFAQLMAIPILAFNTMILPNALAIHYLGYKTEKTALVFISILCAIASLHTIFAIINFI